MTGALGLNLLLGNTSNRLRTGVLNYFRQQGLDLPNSENNFESEHNQAVNQVVRQAQRHNQEPDLGLSWLLESEELSSVESESAWSLLDSFESSESTLDVQNIPNVPYNSVWGYDIIPLIW